MQEIHMICTWGKKRAVLRIAYWLHPPSVYCYIDYVHVQKKTTRGLSLSLPDSNNLVRAASDSNCVERAPSAERYRGMGRSKRRGILEYGGRWGRKR